MPRIGVLVISTQHEIAYDYIKTQILNLHFKPGQYLMDSKIASELEISRTPVREAFLRLKSEGLLEYESYKGWRVYLLTLDDLQEIFDLSAAIEGMVVRKAASCQNAELRQSLEVAFQTLCSLSGNGNAEAWIEADTQFHSILCQMAKSKRAFIFYNSLNEQWHRLRIGFMLIQGRIDRTTTEYRAIIDCVFSGNGEQAEKLSREHLANVHSELVQLLVNFVLPFVENGV